MSRPWRWRSLKTRRSVSGTLKELDKLTGGLIASAIKAEEFKGESGDALLLRFAAKGKVKATKLLLVGVGERADYKPPAIAALSGTATRALRKLNVKSFALLPRSESNASEVAQNAAQGAITSQFELDKYKTKDKNDKTVDTLVICVEDAKPADLKKGIERGQGIGESMNFTRDLANEPPNILTPTEMANRAKAMAKEVGLKCEILDEAKMEKMGMGSLMSVSIGSEQPAKMIVLRYTPAKSTAKKGEMLALVGKGITFDTGGISIKPAEGMDAMKYDMSGGATVIGTMRAIALLKPTVPVLGVVAAVENMPDGKASRPSDVVTAMNGKTIEILNTDAEGRLILADAVAYAEKQGATRIVDMATLTGAVIIALGDREYGHYGQRSGICRRDRRLRKRSGRRILAASDQQGIQQADPLRYSRYQEYRAARKGRHDHGRRLYPGICRQGEMGASRYRRHRVGRCRKTAPGKRPDGGRDQDAAQAGREIAVTGAAGSIAMPFRRVKDYECQPVSRSNDKVRRVQTLDIFFDVYPRVMLRCYATRLYCFFTVRTLKSSFDYRL